MRQLTSDEQRTIEAFIDKGKEDGSQLPGMSYEDGLEAMLMLMDDNLTVAEVVNEQNHGNNNCFTTNIQYNTRLISKLCMVSRSI